MSVGLFFEIGSSTGCGVEVATPNAITVRGTVELWVVGQALIRLIRQLPRADIRKINQHQDVLKL